MKLLPDGSSKTTTKGSPPRASSRRRAMTPATFPPSSGSWFKRSAWKWQHNVRMANSKEGSGFVKRFGWKATGQDLEGIKIAGCSLDEAFDGREHAGARLRRNFELHVRERERCVVGLDHLEKDTVVGPQGCCPTKPFWWHETHAETFEVQSHLSIHVLWTFHVEDTVQPERLYLVCRLHLTAGVVARRTPKCHDDNATKVGDDRWQDRRAPCRPAFHTEAVHLQPFVVVRADRRKHITLVVSSGIVPSTKPQILLPHLYARRCGRSKRR
eukprot:1796007-Rhodomonas_salina.1